MSGVPAAEQATLLEFPLRGEWTALRTPAAGVPTHGTDFLGQRYAYDFVRPTGVPWAPYGPLLPVHAWIGVPVNLFAAWGAPVYAAADGRVVAARDGWPDRPWVHALWDIARLRIGGRWRPLRITADDWRPLAGNYVLIEGPEGVTFYAHLKQGSIGVAVGSRVAVGDRLGLVGHSGRSTMPHLHFQLMDRVDGLHAAGILCGFRSFQRWNGAAWVVQHGLPVRRDRIRFGLEPA